MTYLDEYKQKLIKLENFHDFSIDVSNSCSGQKNIPWKLVRSNHLFIRMTVTCQSFIRLLPFNRIFPAEYEFWDLFSVCSLARNFVETYLLFWYIGVDKISVEESKLRLDILHYHLNSEKYKFYKEFGLGADTLDEFELQLPIRKEEIRTNPLFNSLVIDKNKRKSILSGSVAKYLSNDEIIESVSFKADEFKPLYRWYSNHTHSMPFATFSHDSERGTGRPNRAEIEYISTALDFVTKYLLIAIVDTIGLFPLCEESLNKHKLKIIREEFLVYSQNLPS